MLLPMAPTPIVSPGGGLPTPADLVNSGPLFQTAYTDILGKVTTEAFNLWPTLLWILLVRVGVEFLFWLLWLPARASVGDKDGG